MTDPADPIASKLNALPKYVASKTLKKATWNPTTIIRDVAKDVAMLKKDLSGELQVHGSAGLIQSLLEHDLVDEFNVLTYPVPLGTGKKLFGEGTIPTGLKLKNVKLSAAGVVMATYERTGKPSYGSFALPK